MNNLQVAEWLPSFLIPFFTLSYPTTPPADPDSFHDSLYYTTGILDVCVIVSCIAVMAVLRDITRIYLMEPFAKWKLTRDWERSQRAKPKVNGRSNGSVNGSLVASCQNGEYPSLPMSKRDARRIHRSMLRFAEQGWSFIYYTINFTFGLVSDIYTNGMQASIQVSRAFILVCASQPSHTSLASYRTMVELPSRPHGGYRQVLLSYPDRVLPPPSIDP